MKPALSHFRYALLLVLVVSFYGCKDPGGKIPFDEKKAREHIIPVKQGSLYSSNFLNLRDSVLPRLIADSSFLPRRFTLPISETFNRDAIISLLNADGAQSVRIYFGTDDKGLVRLVLMPVDKDGKDIITKLTGKAGDAAAQAGTSTRSLSITDGDAVENGQRPPPPYGSLGSGN